MAFIVSSMGRRRDGDRHKSRQVNLRLPDVLREQLDVLCDQNLSTITSEIITAVRKHLEQNNLWPPPPKPAKKATSS